MKPITRRISTASASKWIKRAEVLARSLRRTFDTRREILDGYIIEGKRVGDRLKASVIDPPGQIVIAGRTRYYSAANDEPVNILLAGFSYPRDALSAVYTGGVHPPIGDPQGTYRREGAALLARDPAAAYMQDTNGAFIHDVLDLPGGYRSSGLTFAVPSMASGQATISYYRPLGEDIYFRFAFSVTRGLASADPGAAGSATGAARLGLNIDTEWIERYLGGGARLVLDESVRGDASKPPLMSWDGLPYFMDSRGFRWAMPWVVAQPITISPDRVVWRLLTRYGEPPIGPNDAWGRWMLATFDVEVFVEDGVVHAVPGPVERYNPFDSSDVSRVTVPELEGDGMRLNLFGFPATARAGAFLVTHVASPDPGSNPENGDEPYFSFNNVLLTPQRQFVEIQGLPADYSTEMLVPCYGKLRSLVFGGDVIRGTPYFINPFVAPGVLALINGDTGETTLVPRPTLIIPMAIALSPGQRQNRMYYTDDICKGMVSRLGESTLGFPACTVSQWEGSNLCLVSVDIDTLDVHIRGQVADLVTFAEGSGGISRPGVVQYEIAREGAEDIPGVILWGYHAAGNTSGSCFLSTDSGYTWTELSNEYGPARNIWYAGNALSPAMVGTLWAVPPDHEATP